MHRKSARGLDSLERRLTFLLQGNCAVYNRPPTSLNELLPAQRGSENRVDDEITIQVCYRVIFSAENRASSDWSVFCQNVGNDLTMGTSLDSVLEHCPRLEAFRLSGSLCSAHVMRQIIQGSTSASEHLSSLRVLGLRPVEVGVLCDIAPVLNVAGVGAGLERVVIAEGDLRVVSEDARHATLKKFDELRRKGVDVVFAEHLGVGDLL